MAPRCRTCNQEFTPDRLSHGHCAACLWFHLQGANRQIERGLAEVQELRRQLAEARKPPRVLKRPPLVIEDE